MKIWTEVDIIGTEKMWVILQSQCGADLPTQKTDAGAQKRGQSLWWLGSPPESGDMLQLAKNICWEDEQMDRQNGRQEEGGRLNQILKRNISGLAI